MDFSYRLVNWYRQKARILPWRETKNPYFIWLSEIILQQTRVAQGQPYYEKFILAFPTVQALANADEQEVIRLWQGLGYYSRARNLHHAAKYISNECKGIFPQTFVELKKMKGVGDYSAAAITSFAYGLPHAVVDGNVYRVLSRIFGIDLAIDSTEGKKHFGALANELINENSPAIHNQAIMEFGALQCTPKAPNCISCVFKEECIAFLSNQILVLPVKLKKVAVKIRYLNYFFIENIDGSTFVRKRIEKDIWKHLYEFPLRESNDELDYNTLLDYGVATFGIQSLGQPYEVKHVLSHQHLCARIFVLKCNIQELEGFEKILMTNLIDYPLPRLLDRFLEIR
jgi:A/G-specific adenine glycosylase